MNKTLKTVLITLAVTFAFLFAIVMFFGEAPTAPDPPSSQGAVTPANASISTGADTPIEADSASEDTDNMPSPEQYQITLAYDVFDWNLADEQGKAEIAEAIISVWAAYGDSYDQDTKALVTYISQHLYDQANIFEVACVAAQIDSLPYFERMN